MAVANHCKLSFAQLRFAELRIGKSLEPASDCEAELAYSKARVILRARSNSSRLERVREPIQAGQLHFAETYEVVAEHPALVFQAFVDADRNLSGESVAASQDGCADDGGKFGIDHGLAAHDHEAAIEFGIVAGMMNAIDFAPSHRRPWLRLGLLIAEDVLHFFS